MPDDPNWLSSADWQWAQHHLPIACADVLPVQRGPAGEIARVGLIARSTPHQGAGRWCLVGGRLRRGESATAGATRQLHEALGPAIQFTLPPQTQPNRVVEYFPAPAPGELLDPRQHAIALTFVVAIEGPVHPAGEAADFRWFTPTTLPPPDAWGFGQDAVVHHLLR